MSDNWYRIKDENSDLYWHNGDGWVDRTSAHIFDQQEFETLNLPNPGHWVVVTEELWDCDHCGELWPEEALHSSMVFAGNQEEPDEWEHTCPDCIAGYSR